ncbi:MAG: hypothetical protein Q9208_002651 [Pyrenodesmia sp. 3 TL-2023]
MSDLLRDAKEDASSPHAEEIARCLSTGALVSGHIATSVLEGFIHTLLPDSSQIILLDGFPRDIEQAQTFEKQVGKAIATISLSCSAATCKKRREDRARLDDAPETGDARFQAHLRDTVPTIEYLRGNGCKVVEVN